MNPYGFKLAMGTADNAGGRFKDGKGQVTENVIMRLAFHDCIPYMDGTGKLEHFDLLFFPKASRLLSKMQREEK